MDAWIAWRRLIVVKTDMSPAGEQVNMYEKERNWVSKDCVHMKSRMLQQ